jgi:hypothetical protein
VSLFVEESSPWVFLLLTVVIGGGAAVLAGRALASTWRPVWQAIAYMCLLGFAVRFFHYSLFGGTLLSAHYYLVDTAVLWIGALLGYRVTRVRQMTSQYPWLYVRTGPFTWREKSAQRAG